MRMTAAFPILALGMTTALASACASWGPQAAEDPSSAAADTIRGTLAVVGADPLARPAIRPGDGSPDVFLTGPGAGNASTFQGMEVWAQGSLDADGRELDVERLEIRSVNGTVALQGTLTAEGARWYLLLDDGRRVPLRNVPQALQAQEGERVWIAAPVDVGGGSFGPAP